MVRKIKAILEDVESEIVLLKVGDFTLEAYPSFNILKDFKIGDQYDFYAFLELNDWSSSLYIFKDNIEREVFEMLKKVSKIGPRMASKILRKIDAREFIALINSQDKEELEKLPGIGKKTAERLVSELQESLSKYSNIDNIHHKKNKNSKEAIEALESLGFQKYEILKVLEELNTSDMSTEEIIKKCLSRL
ncbi:Holliday junction branch migration protein RuvA [Petrotoga sp. 9PW.55.5.1]|uniref:Holliday junction branch migration protein RuvA n=1 Tax=Petrotoga sp. 9PW.55.5.1 TaxID=1308979 RepID=UPI000DD9CA7D|nr:Holliday junction branch migration protein RuvA [Petrotoga sp. 9PW.55.5.1]